MLLVLLVVALLLLLVGGGSLRTIAFIVITVLAVLWLMGVTGHSVGWRW